MNGSGIGAGTRQGLRFLDYQSRDDLYWNELPEEVEEAGTKIAFKRYFDGYIERKDVWGHPFLKHLLFPLFLSISLSPSEFSNYNVFLENTEVFIKTPSTSSGSIQIVCLLPYSYLFLYIHKMLYLILLHLVKSKFRLCAPKVYMVI